MDAWVNVVLPLVCVPLIIGAASGASRIFESNHPRRKLQDIGEAAEVLESLAPGSPARPVVSAYLELQMSLLERSNSRRAALLKRAYEDEQATSRQVFARLGPVLGWIVAANILTFGFLLLAVPGSLEMTTIQFVVICIAITGTVAIIEDVSHSIRALRAGARWRSSA
jgi:hypothetical protein